MYVRVHVDAMGGQKRAFGSLELELRAFVSHPTWDMTLDEHYVLLGTEPFPRPYSDFSTQTLLFLMFAVSYRYEIRRRSRHCPSSASLPLLP